MGLNIGVVSLGCAKNLVDTEVMLGILGHEGYRIVSDPAEAEVIIVNTCAFIDSAKEESINTVLEMAAYKEEKCRLLIVCGCMAERYHDEIMQELPEVDAVVGTGDYVKIADVIRRAEQGEKPVLYGHMNDELPEEARMLSTPGYMAYLKIADGCDNCCTYCIIPKLRGKYRSRPMEDIVSEAQELAASGVKELIVIAQDTSRYGIDLYGAYKLPVLLKQLCAIDGVHWVRVLYVYPEMITDELIETYRTEKKLVHYMDIPIQHAHDAVLKKMGRHLNHEKLVALLEKLRKAIPDMVLRTTVITGFPGETEEAFKTLLLFVKTMRFDRLGAFPYSKEEGTPAAKLSDQLPEDVKVARAEEVLRVQAEISLALQNEKIGTVLEVLTEGYDEESLMYYGRSAGDAPEVDNTVYFVAMDEVEIGSFVPVEILTAEEYELVGRMITEEEEE
ncbi:MAG: 30S ribosomal protein S12 methylthiotransferase RimO [Ruminococcaceae bacterium]|nr:30S ribosomal protein S12 methylthiotransferase RimO [Oscillospiraceae bacterium]